MAREVESYNRRQIAEILEVHPNTILEFENRFNITVPRIPGDKRQRRFYTDKELDLFKYIKKCYDEGLQASAITNLLIKKGIVKEQEKSLSEKITTQQLTVEKFIELQEGLFTKMEEKLTEKITEEVRKQFAEEREQRLREVRERLKQNQEKSFWRRFFK